MHYKIILDKRRSRKDNKYPLKLRIYEGDKYKDKSLNISIHETEWDADTQVVLKECKNHGLYNAKLTQEKAVADKRVLFGIEPAAPQKPSLDYSFDEYSRRAWIYISPR